MAFVKSVLLSVAVVALAALGSEALRIDGGRGLKHTWDDDSWYVQNDGVMGGKSSGVLDFLTDNTVMKFTGDIVLDGGGFSSVRRSIDLDLSNYAGVVVTLEAGVPMPSSSSSSSFPAPTGLHLQFGQGGSRWDFSSALAIPLSSTQTVASVYLPIESFDRASRGGGSCWGDNCVFDPSEVDQMSVYVLFQEGLFDVRLRSIEAVAEPRAFVPPAYNELKNSNDAMALIRSTISSGGSLYDKSYVELCVALYWSTLNTILASPGVEVVPDPVRVVICAGLQHVEEQNRAGSSKQDQAWTLRYVMDSVTNDLEGSARTTVQEWLPTVSEAAAAEVACLPRTSQAYGYWYDPTNAYELDEDSFGNSTAFFFDEDLVEEELVVEDLVEEELVELELVEEELVEEELVESSISRRSPDSSGGRASFSAPGFRSVAASILLLGMAQLL